MPQPLERLLVLHLKEVFCNIRETSVYSRDLHKLINLLRVVDIYHSTLYFVPIIPVCTKMSSKENGVVQDYKLIIEDRRTKLSAKLLKTAVAVGLKSDQICKNVCEELNDESVLRRNWKGLADYLGSSLGKNVVRKCSKDDNPAFQLLTAWAVDESRTFDMLLEALVKCQTYSAADELLLFLEHVNENELELFESNHDESTQRPTACNTNHPDPETRDEIFIVCTKEDEKSVDMKNLKQFLSTLKSAKKRKWTVTSINDVKSGPTVQNWLTERVSRASYVLVCFSNNLKRIYTMREDLSLVFTLEVLIQGNMFLDSCYNTGGKYLPILLRGNPFKCILHFLALFNSYNWPKDKENLKNYLSEKRERNMGSTYQRRRPLTQG